MSNLPFQPPPDWLPSQYRLTVPAKPSSRSHTLSHEQDLRIDAEYTYTLFCCKYGYNL